ncbi:MAG: response regulator [Candidatus Omnitrophica bacterium]|nr:response regulator [Candidatus Omnitrophota bacterium]
MENKKILVVDDEPDLVAFVKLRLEAHNYSVVTAKDGKEALSVFDKENPDLVLLDILMPKIDGLKVCQTIRKDPSKARIPIIMLTAKDRSDDIHKAKEVGANGYIVKPFEAATLLFEIKSLLDKEKI